MEVYASVTNLFDTDPPVTPLLERLRRYAIQDNPACSTCLAARFVVGAKCM